MSVITDVADRETTQGSAVQYLKTLVEQYALVEELYGVIGISRDRVQVYTEADFRRLVPEGVEVTKKTVKDWSHDEWSAMVDGLKVVYLP